MSHQKQSQIRHIDSILPPPQQRPKKRPVARRWILAVCLLLIFMCISAVVFWHFSQAKQNLGDVNVVVNLVDRHYVLPSNEKPALATVTDKSKLQSSLSGKVQNGDKILIYQKNQKAIIYRPSIDKIVDVEPVSIDAPPAQAGKNSN